MFVACGDYKRMLVDNVLGILQEIFFDCLFQVFCRKISLVGNFSLFCRNISLDDFCVENVL